MKDMNSLDQLIHTTVRIEGKFPDGGASTGTGYFFGFHKQENGIHKPHIVTNKHVIEGTTDGVLYLTEMDTKTSKPIYGKYHQIHVSNFEKQWNLHPDPDIDLAILPLAPLIRNYITDSFDFFYICIDEDMFPSEEELEELSAIEEIIMVGYPNGIWDSKHNLPIVRKGITATHPKFDYNGSGEFLIDAACFPGSSGSPVFIANAGSFVKKDKLHLGSRTRFLGTLYAGPQHLAEGNVEIVKIPTNTNVISKTMIPNNLGLVINFGQLQEFEKLFIGMK